MSLVKEGSRRYFNLGLKLVLAYQLVSVVLDDLGFG